jgi:ethanolamine utilization microcompartment shell protein EutS
MSCSYGTPAWAPWPGEAKALQARLSKERGNFLTGTVERFVGDVVLHADTGPVRHMRLAALQRSQT